MKNPVNSMTADEQNNLNTQIKQKATVKCQRVTNYLGSEGFKSSLTNNLNNFIFQDKITNSNPDNVKNLLKSDI